VTDRVSGPHSLVVQEGPQKVENVSTWAADMVKGCWSMSEGSLGPGCNRSVSCVSFRGAGASESQTAMAERKGHLLCDRSLLAGAPTP
jgi:hypothetical protein